MDQLFQALYSGVLYGSVYGLMALGLTLIWGALRMLNLAHGALYLVGGYAAWVFLNPLGLGVLPTLVLATLVAAVAGAVLHFVAINPLVGNPNMESATLISTLGVAIAVESGALLIFGPQNQQMPETVTGNLIIGTVLIQYQGLLVIGVAIVSLVAMNLFLRSTRYGMGIRAVSQNMDAARLMGIPVWLIYLIVIITSAALAGLAGVLLSSIFYIYPSAGFNPMIRALVVTIFGGLGSISGTLYAAYIIGLLEAFLQVYLGGSYALPGLFLFMILMLIIRPNGLFGLGEVRRL